MSSGYDVTLTNSQQLWVPVDLSVLHGARERVLEAPLVLEGLLTVNGFWKWGIFFSDVFTGQFAYVPIYILSLLLKQET